MTTKERLVTLRIGQIARDRAFQMRKKVDAGTVQRYAGVYRSGKEMPPVDVAVVEGVHILVDGWHRVAALERLGRTSVEAKVIDASSRAAAVLLGVQANLAHGVPLKRAEVRTAFRAFVRAKGHVLPRGKLMSYAELAKYFGKSKGTMHTWMRRDFKRVAAAMGSEGNFKGTGGLIERLRTSPRKAAAMAGLEALRRAFQASSDANERGDILEAARAAVEEMAGSGGWEASDF